MAESLIDVPGCIGGSLLGRPAEADIVDPAVPGGFDVGKEGEVFIFKERLFAGQVEAAVHMDAASAVRPVIDRENLPDRLKGDRALKKDISAAARNVGSA